MLHDINPDERQEIIKVMAQKLKTGARLYIEEPTKESHGMQKDEIIDLMKNAGLKLEKSTEDKSSFKGEFIKVKS